ncbi:GAF domain-containing protein [Cesiribacter sp. SM1]|uniref:GAF domain-containing protein n=1 Tax=Cesiribacter sp. SM1 TaxID=2861196 RepID=UPI001CD27FEF|nr:GAF domain-containing protein [Cesiribacter sp. SM1]
MNITFDKFWKMGVKPEMPQYLKNKVQTSNIVCVSLMFIALVYWVVSVVFHPELTFIPLIGVFVILGAGALNFFGAITFSRFILSTVPTALAILYQAYLVKADGEPLVGTMLLALSFSAISFILFDLREGSHVYLPSVVCFLLIACFPYLRNVLELPIDDTLYRSGILYHMTVAIAFALNFVNVVVLAYVNLLSDKQSEVLLSKAEEQRLEMQHKEEELHKNLEELQKAQEEERRRAWASEGFSRFGAVLRRHDGEQHLYDTLLASLIKYIGVNQGGLYLAEGEGKEVQLVLRSAYAYDRKKYRNHQVAPGQGLLGQCYLERDYTYLTKIPQNYVSITSGLGDATPSALLLVPLLYEEEVMGVLELASFKPFPPHVIDFLMKLGNDIAATVHANRINSLTQQLLEQAQEQTEMMRAQEEEMRQNMEELNATQEELQRKEREYMRQIAELEERMQTQSVPRFN